MGNTSVKPHPRSRHKKQVHWKAADRPSPPGKPQLVSESEITPDVVTIRWDPPRNDGGAPITGYLVEHRRYGSPHWVRATPLLVPFTKLSLSGLEPGWRYQFRISAENAVGLSAPGELSELLTVTLQRSAITAPRFIEELKDSVALENEKVEFVAHFLGQPAPKICWFKDGFEIFSSRRIRIITENDRSVLTIHQSALSDEGEIKCTATNRAGHASTKANLSLEAPPSIRLPRQYEDGLLFELGEAIRLKVSIAGRPTPLIYWSHNNESIKSDDQHEIESTDKYSSVRIQEAKRSDRGEYQVRAVNKLGEAIASFLVTVTDKPAPPGQARVVMTLGRSVTLSWTIPSDDGGCKIGNYIVEYFRIGWDVWLKAATSRQLTTTIGDLIEGSEYKFRVKAESPYGVSEPSDESDVVFIPDAKRGILTPSAARSRSQPRNIFSKEFAPVPAKRQPRSLSSTRAENVPKRTSTPVHFYDGGVPVRPTRSKVKSPSITPEPSPANNRRSITADGLDKNIFDRSSMARDLAYGTPEMKIKPNEEEMEHYESKQLDQPTNIVMKSTVNVIHHQTSTPLSIKPRSLSPRLQKAESPPPTSNFASYMNDSRVQPRQKSPNPQPFISPNRRSPSPPRQRRRSPSPLPELKKSPSPLSKPKRAPSPLPRTSPQPFISPNRRSPSPPRQRRSSSPLLELEKLPSPLSKPKRVPSPLPRTRRTPSPLPEDRKQSDTIVINSIEDRRPSNESSDGAFSPLRFTRSRSRSPSPIEVIRHEAVNPKYNFNTTQDHSRRNDLLSNSSEFMLVLLPENQRGRGSTSDIKFDFDENSVPPPMSLSAPELGAEHLFLEPLRVSVSSTELLHEQAIQRFYQALEAEEAELEKKSQNNNETTNKIELPKIQINSKDDQVIVGLERKSSLRRRLSAGGLTVPQQLLWAQRRHSLRNTPDLTELPESNLRKYPALLDNVSVETPVANTKPEEDNSKQFPLTLDDKRELFATRQRSESEEREEEEFKKVREKMASQKKEARKTVVVVKEEEWDEVANEYEESISESETESSEDERIYDEVPPPTRLPEDEEEEETYHPGLMQNKVDNLQKSKKDEPFEILTKPNPLPDPNFIPKPILKRRDIEDIPDKPVRKTITPNTNTSRERSLSMFPKTPNNFKEAKSELENNSRQRSFSLFPQNTQRKNVRDTTAMRKRGHSPTVPNRSGPLTVGDFSNIFQIPEFPIARPAAPPPPPVVPKKTDEEIKVVVDHYGDIVRSYGQKKKSTPQVYLNADDLKAAAERQSKEDLREIEKSMENLAPSEEQKDQSESLQLPTENEERRGSFVLEASVALFNTVKEKVSAAFSGEQQVEDDIIPPDEIIPPRERRGSSQMLNKRRPSRSPSKSEVVKAAKRGGGGSGSAESNWSNLRAPSPTRQVRKGSPSPMRRTSLIAPAVQTRRTSLGSVTPGKIKMRENTTQTPDDSSLDPKRDILLAARQEELSAKAEYKVRTTVDYITDLAMFAVACWLYLFQNELLAIPVLLVMVYRQLKEEIKKKLPNWMLGKKKVKRK